MCNSKTHDNPTIVNTWNATKLIPNLSSDGDSPAMSPTDYSAETWMIYPPVGALSPTTGALSPTQGALSPTTGALSPTTGALSPNQGALSPTTGALSPTTGALSPTTGALSPTTGALSPTTGALSPTTECTDIKIYNEVSTNYTVMGQQLVCSTSGDENYAPSDIGMQWDLNANNYFLVANLEPSLGRMERDEIVPTNVTVSPEIKSEVHGVLASEPQPPSVDSEKAERNRIRCREYRKNKKLTHKNTYDELTHLTLKNRKLKAKLHHLESNIQSLKDFYLKMILAGEISFKPSAHQSRNTLDKLLMSMEDHFTSGQSV